MYAAAYVVGRSAAHAPLRVGRVLELRRGVPRVVETEDGRTGPLSRQVADLRVVAVHDQGGIGRKLSHGPAPALGQELELAVAVELVAEQVPEQHRPRMQPPRHLGECRLVDLEQPELRVRCRQESGGDARDQVGARPVVGQPRRRREDAGGHRRRGRLPVGGREQRRAPGQARRQAGRPRPGPASRAAFRARSCLRRPRRPWRGARPCARAGSRPRAGGAGARDGTLPRSAGPLTRLGEVFGASPSRGM